MLFTRAYETLVQAVQLGSLWLAARTFIYLFAFSMAVVIAWITRKAGHPYGKHSAWLIGAKMAIGGIDIFLTFNDGTLDVSAAEWPSYTALMLGCCWPLCYAVTACPLWLTVLALGCHVPALLGIDYAVRCSLPAAAAASVAASGTIPGQCESSLLGGSGVCPTEAALPSASPPAHAALTSDCSPGSLLLRWLVLGPATVLAFFACHSWLTREAASSEPGRQAAGAHPAVGACSIVVRPPPRHLGWAIVRAAVRVQEAYEATAFASHCFWVLDLACVLAAAGQFLYVCTLGFRGQTMNTVWSPYMVLLLLVATYRTGSLETLAFQRTLMVATQRVLNDLLPAFVAARLVEDEVEAEESRGGSQSKPSAGLAAAPKAPATPKLSQMQLLAGRSPFSWRGTFSTPQLSPQAAEDDRRQPDAGGPAEEDTVLRQLTDLIAGLESKVGVEEGGGKGSREGEQQHGCQPSTLRGPQPLATHHPAVTLLFSDIVGFSTICERLEPIEVMTMLNELYHQFDTAAKHAGKVFKIETIGDAYVCATGLLHEDPDHAGTMVDFARTMQRLAGTVAVPRGEPGQTLRLRIGLHSGPVMSGVIGTVRKRYCLFGTTMNCASRMESHGVPGRIHVSSATHALVASHPEYVWQCRGETSIKNMGSITTYLLAEDGEGAAALQEPASESEGGGAPWAGVGVGGAGH